MEGSRLKNECIGLRQVFQSNSIILTTTITIKDIIRGRMPTLANLAIGKDIPELLACASSQVARKINKVITAAILITALTPKAAIVVTVVTVVTVVITSMLFFLCKISL